MPGLFGDKNTGGQAARAENKFTQQGIDAILPFLQAGTEQLPGLAEGATVGGLGARLNEIIGGGAFGGLIDERQRGLQGQLSAGGLTRSGTALESAANIPAELALQLEQLLTGRSQSLAGQGLGAGGSIANLFSQQGVAAGSGIVTDAQASAAGLGQIGKIASGIFFSDPRLKINVMQIGELGGLPLVEWDWIPQAEGTIIWDCPRVGFMADDVETIYPEFVGEFGGWKSIDYPRLRERLQANLNRKIEAEAA